MTRQGWAAIACVTVLTFTVSLSSGVVPTGAANRGVTVAASDSSRQVIDPASSPLIVAGGDTRCALFAGGTAKCWGDNFFGQLGLGDTANRGNNGIEMGTDLRAVDLGAGRTVTDLALAGAFACAILDNGRVKCWGNNSGGQLGLGIGYDDGHGFNDNKGDQPGEVGDDLPYVDLGTGRTAIAIFAGGQSACAILDNHTLKCWGANNKGQLGLGDTANRGDGPNEMGDNLPAVDLGTGFTPTTVSIGGASICALLADRTRNSTVKCWGSNEKQFGSVNDPQTGGQLGLGDIANRGDNPNEMGNNLPAVNLGTGRSATSISGAGGHTCARLDNGTVKCWGWNQGGQLGLGDTNARGDGPNEMGDNLPAVNLGTSRTATAVRAYGGYTCALLDNQTVKCWGSGYAGVLGQGDTTSRGDGPNEMGDNLAAVSVGAGRQVTALSVGDGPCVRLDNGATKCWGPNSSGQLGQGDTIFRGDGPNEMGDNLPVIDLVGGISGTIAETGSGAGVRGAWIAALRTTDYSLVGGTNTASGSFHLGLRPGTYLIYALDPTGAHTGGFFGPPTAVTVTGAAITAANPSLAPTRGALAGTVTETGSGVPVPGAWTLALNGTSAAFETAVIADGTGHFTLPNLSAGGHYLAYLDPTGTHATRFHPGSPDIFGATKPVVVGGSVTTANGSLPVQAPFTGGASIAGTVTDDATLARLGDVFVFALRASDFAIVRGTVTAAPPPDTGTRGIYNLSVPPGTYRIGFIDPTGQHHMEWHDNQPASSLATSTIVTAPATVNAALAPTTGTMAGTITETGTGAPIAGAWVMAIGPQGPAGGAIAAADGRYTIDSLPPGTYRAEVIDPTARHALEFYNNSPDYVGATAITIAAAATATINTGLSPT